MSASQELVVHMLRVQSAERDLRELGTVWQTIECSAAISCPEEVAGILTTLVHTRERFAGLQHRLVERMADENIAALGDELRAKAQCTLDILVRNLFERTADVGFLATDGPVVAHCLAAPPDRAAGRAALERRLREYQLKYSVYDDIVVFSPQGEVLARLDGAQALARSSDGVIATALATRGFVERYGASDLAAPGERALRYAHRIEGPDGRAAGVLVLRFRFADEMQRIFDSVADVRQPLTLVLFDAERRVVISSDEASVPTGARLPALEPGDVALTVFGGRECLAVDCHSQGFHGYAGPGWTVRAMVSLFTAFRGRDDGSRNDGLDAGRAAVPLDHPELLAIDRDAEAINRELRRVVWNGRIQAGEGGGQGRGEPARLKAVLTQVATTGERTRERVERAIGELHRTSLARAARQAAELARLAADLMDRSLYERANDCRWWALSPLLQQALAAPAGAPGSAALNRALDHINGLYTVYSRLVAFDAAGVVRGASHAETPDAAGQPLVGQAIDPRWREAVARLAAGPNASQQYAVSAFEPTPLHEHGATYVFLAAVRAPDDERRLAGGVAIVFNAAHELAAMLRDVLGARAGFAAFVDAGGRVIASQGDAGALAAVPAQSRAGVLEHAGVHCAWASAPATGYREFKHEDGHANGVSAVVGLRLGAGEPRRSAGGETGLSASPPADRRDALALAVFRVGAMRYALPADAVIEAVPAQDVVRTPGGGARVGLLEAGRGGARRLVPVVCGAQVLGGGGGEPPGDHAVVLLLRSPQDAARPLVGLRVDDVLTVLDVDRTRLQEAPAGLRSFAPWVRGLIDGRPGPKPGDGRTGVQEAADRKLVQVLDEAALRARLAADGGAAMD